MLELSPVGLPIFVLWNVLSVIILSPLECAIIRLSTQRPERQNPLHRAYARVPNGSNATGPSPYSHQATAAAQAQPGGSYKDSDPARKSSDSTSANADKPLPSSPGELPGRPSFAIEDDDDDDRELLSIPPSAKPASVAPPKNLEENLENVAVVRIEQLYPFPKADYDTEIARYPNATDIVWCQEEPQNQGAWYQSRHHLEAGLSGKHTLSYAGRAASASPAVGSHQVHVEQQTALVSQALGL